MIPLVEYPPAISSDEVSRARWAVSRATNTGEDLLGLLAPQWRPGAAGERLPGPQRLREGLAARYALSRLVPELTRAASRLSYGVYGQPILEQSGGVHHVSLSHSHGAGAALLADVPCGIDLQRLHPNIFKLRQRFETDQEAERVKAAADELRALHVLWSAKEALYKTWAKRGLDWRRDIQVHHLPDPDQTGSSVAAVGHARVGLPGERFSASLYACWIEDFCLVAALKTQPDL